MKNNVAKLQRGSLAGIGILSRKHDAPIVAVFRRSITTINNNSFAA